MKTLKSILLISFGLFCIYACEKEGIQSKRSIPISSRERIIPEETTLPPIRRLPQVVSGILKFDNKQHLSEFWDDIERSNEDQLNLLEQTLGYTSIRSLYYEAEGRGEILSESFPFLVKNPHDELVFNQYHELWVGDNIYKLVGDRLLSTTTSAFLPEIISMRENDGMVREHVDLVDMNTNEVFTEVKTNLGNKCTLIFTTSDPVTIDNGRRIDIVKKVIDQNGNEMKNCIGREIIFFGDGKSGTIINENLLGSFWSHVYPVDIGECKTFKIKMQVELENCGSCTASGSQFLEVEKEVAICNLSICSKYRDHRSEKEVFSGNYESDSGHLKTAKFYMGYDAHDYWWHDARVWTRIKHFDNTNGMLCLSKCGDRISLQLNFDGGVYKVTCMGDRIDVDETDSVIDKKEIRLRKRFDGVDIRFRSDLDLFADFTVYNPFSGSIKLRLRDVPFSTL